MHAVRIQDARIEEFAPANWEIQAGGLLLGLRYVDATCLPGATDRIIVTARYR